MHAHRLAGCMHAHAHRRAVAYMRIAELRMHAHVLAPHRYAELLADNRGFSPEEDEYFSAQAQHAYESFRDKAALSRGMSAEAMQAVAQARACLCRALGARTLAQPNACVSGRAVPGHGITPGPSLQSPFHTSG